ncbi:hypothetical protein SM966_03885 [Escherichia coli]|uniref:PTS system, galactose-specific IIC component n=2 Tax=Escherichia coli TaxID=562 RepID=A0A6G6ALM2_ECOLX|nr:hypothetical protein [Escherichia coli]QID22675.1 PTS system, galactose-specific IIC component [Escherichia coli]QID23154.1 PTS system, galactose-specific IIC component [Escherichia coli]HCY2264517.1 hypothetical protein [Escherichia coli]
MVNELISRFIPFIDKYDFDAEKLNEKIGFWGSKFAIGVYLGFFVGILGKLPMSELFALAFTAGVSLELFSAVGNWFGPAIRMIFLTKKTLKFCTLIILTMPLSAALTWVFRSFWMQETKSWSSGLFVSMTKGIRK